MPQLPPFQTWFVELIGIVSNMLVGIAAVIGIMGLWRWRTELEGKTRFEVARKLSLLALQFQRQVQLVRAGFLRGWESIERKPQGNETLLTATIFDEWYVRQKRFEPLGRIMTEMEQASAEAELLIGDIEPLIRPFREAYSELEDAIHTHFSDKTAQSAAPNSTARKDSRKQSKATDEIVHSHAEDKFAEKVDAAVTNLRSCMEKSYKSRALFFW